MAPTSLTGSQRLRQAQPSHPGITLRAVVEAALRSYLSGRRGRGGYRLRWRTERGTIQPGVRPDDRDTLFDLMDGRV